MTKKRMTLQQQFEKLGWELIGTGGGCEAYQLAADKPAPGRCPRRYWLLTVAGGAEIPTRRRDICILGYYEDTEEMRSGQVTWVEVPASAILDKVVKFADRVI